MMRKMMMTQSRVSYLVLLGLIPLFGTACSTMPRDFETPKVSIANIAPKDFSIFEQRFDVQLRIQNPNDADLSIKGLRCEIELNDKEFGSGMSGQKVTVPRFGSEVINVEVITGLGSFLKQAQSLNSSGGTKLRYRLKGTAFAESPGTFKVPFDETGEVDLNFSAPQEK